MIAQKKGHIVSIASVAGLAGGSGLVDYCTSKFGAVGLVESLRHELDYLGHNYIKTTCVCPYLINTGMFKGVTLSKQFILPYLKENDVAERVIRGVRMEEQIIIMPYMAKCMVYLKYILTPSQISLSIWWLGLNKFMSTFEGRK